MKSLTQTEMSALRVIRNSVMHHGRTPSVRELMKELGYKSPRSAALIIGSLISKRILRKKSNGSLQLDKFRFESQQVDTINVPLIGTVECGMPVLAEEHVEAMIPVSTRLAPPPHKYFLLRASGDSMNEIGIEEGKLLLIRQQQTAQSGDIVVACIDGETTVKEYRSDSDIVILRPKSRNKAHKPIIVDKDFMIQGVVLKVISEL